MAAGAGARAVLVIGAHCVLGTAVVRAFEDAGWRVLAGVRQSAGARGSTVVDLDRTRSGVGAPTPALDAPMLFAWEGVPGRCDACVGRG